MVRLFESIRKIFHRPAGPDQTDTGLALKFFDAFGYHFKTPGHLREALTHRSYVRNVDHKARSNERLEFLGDSVLGILVSEYLHSHYPDYAEGELTKTKALLVNETALAGIAKTSRLNEFIFLSDDEERTGGRDRASITSDAFEAVVGAIYLDGGLDPARDFIYRILLTNEKKIISDENQRNYKGELLEYLQARGENPPYYEVVSENGPDHAKIFRVAVNTGGTITGIGEGSTKKEAEQRAAADSLQKLEEINQPDKED